MKKTIEPYKLTVFLRPKLVAQMESQEITRDDAGKEIDVRRVGAKHVDPDSDLSALGDLLNQQALGSIKQLQDALADAEKTQAEAVSKAVSEALAKQSKEAEQAKADLKEHQALVDSSLAKASEALQKNDIPALVAIMQDVAIYPAQRRKLAAQKQLPEAQAKVAELEAIVE